MLGKTTGGNVSVTIDGSDLPLAAYRDLLQVSVQDDVEVPSVFTLTLVSWDDRLEKISWADSPLFALGGNVVVSLGYDYRFSRVITGEITGIELEMSVDSPPTLVARGYDLRHRMLRGTNTRVFDDMSDSAIAKSIARAWRLRADVRDSGVVYEQVIQRSQADLEFLSERAARIGWEVWVDDRTLFFQPHRSLARAQLVLTAEADIIDFQGRMTTRTQAGAVEVRGWDPKTKKPIVGRAKASSVFRGPPLGAALADKEFGPAVVTVVDASVSQQDEADQMAEGKLRAMELDFIQGDVTCFGRADLRAGMVVDLRGLGTRFSGNHFVTNVTHTYSPSQGYRTSFSTRKDAT